MGIRLKKKEEKEAEKIKMEEFESLKKVFEHFIKIHKLSKKHIDRVLRAFNDYKRLASTSCIFRPFDLGITWCDGETPFNPRNSNERYSYFHFLSLRWVAYLIENQPMYEHLYSSDIAISQYNVIEAYKNVDYNSGMFVSLCAKKWIHYIEKDKMCYKYDTF